MTAPIGIYVRVSRKGDREDERFHSPREQAERATALVEARGYVAGPVFEDIDVSGATPPAERPAMGALLEAIDRGELGGAAAFSLDRYSRDPGHGDELVRRITKAGGVMLAPDVPDDIDSPTGEFTFGMLLQVARLYRSQAGARFASAKERAILHGIPVGPIPVGYRARNDRTLEPDPKTAPAIRELFERRAAGEGYTALADLIGRATGRTWTRQGVADILRRRLYATGRLEYDGLVSEVPTEPLVDEPLWHAAQTVTPRPRAGRSKAPWLLTGLARCAACHLALIPWVGARRYRRDPRRGKMDWVTMPDEKRYRRYRCTNRKCEARASVEANRLESWVVLQSFAVGDEMSTREQETDLAPLEEAVALAERRVEQVDTPEAMDALGELWAANVKARRAERDAALAELGQARQAVGVDASEFRLRDVWDELDAEDRRAALSLFWRAIYVGRKGPKGTPLRFVARGPRAEVDVSLPEKRDGAG